MTLCIPKIIIKKIYFFSSINVKMSGKSINLDNKNIQKRDFNKQKIVQNRRR